MCLYATHHFPKIAWKPITVYKRLERYNNDVRTACMEYRVESGQLMRADYFPLHTKRIVEHGIHAYIDLCTAIQCKYECEFIAVATIPRFSLYYLGTYNEICSSRLQLPKF